MINRRWSAIKIELTSSHVCITASLLDNSNMWQLKHNKGTFITDYTNFHTHFHCKKWYANFGQNGGEIWKIIEIGIDMYIYFIYSWSGGKNKTFLTNVCPSVRPCAKVIYTKTRTGRDNRVRFFCLKGVYRESKLPKFRPERTKIYEARAEWNF